MNRDPSYRYYNCNLQAPNIKCQTLTGNNIVTTALNGILTSSGTLPYGNSFDVTIPSMQLDTACGDLTCYIVNDASLTSGVLMISIFKSAKALNAILYQNIGNYTSGVGVSLTIVNTTTIRITLPPGTYGTCDWSYKGI